MLYATQPQTIIKRPEDAALGIYGPTIKEYPSAWFDLEPIGTKNYPYFRLMPKDDGILRFIGDFVGSGSRKAIGLFTLSFNDGSQYLFMRHERKDGSLVIVKVPALNKRAQKSAPATTT